MRRAVSIDDLSKFILEHYPSKAAFCREMKMSRSHLDGILEGRVRLGTKLMRRLDPILKDKGWTLSDVLLPQPMQIGKRLVEEILVTKAKDGELIASITSADFIADIDYKVSFLPDHKS